MMTDMRGHRDNPTVNRCLDDKAMDHIDHALGRPVEPQRETYRNHYAVGKDSETASEFRASPNWSEGQPSDLNQDLRWFYVTDAGRKALADHLKTIGEGSRRFVVSWEGFDSVVAAKTHAKARYSKYLDISDIYSDLTFKEFSRNARVRLA